MGHTDRMARAREGKPSASVTQPPAARPRRKIDLDAAPAGYDADVWGLAVYFERIAEERGFELAAGRPILYARLENRINKSGIRNQTLGGKPIRNWVGFVEIMINDFWDDEVWLASAAYAIDQFCGVETFEMLQVQFLRFLAARRASKTMVRQPDHHRTPEQQRRVDERVRRREEEEAAAAPPPRTRPRRSWEEIRADLKRISAETKSRRSQ